MGDAIVSGIMNCEFNQTKIVGLFVYVYVVKILPRPSTQFLLELANLRILHVTHKAKILKSKKKNKVINIIRIGISCRKL